MKFLKRLFGIKSVPSGIPIKVDSSSQDYKLQMYMMEQRMTHDETVEADIKNVRVSMEYGVPVMYFCGMRGIDVKKRISRGDGKAIPHRATLKDLNFPVGAEQGYYDLKNVKLHSNGTMQVIATAGTEWDFKQPAVSGW